MAGTITTDQTTVNAAEATTNWFTSGGANFAAVGDIQREGTNCLQARVSNGTMWMGVPDTTGTDLTDGRHIYWWYKSASFASDDTKANGGRVIWISSDATPTITGASPNDGATNSKNWRMDGGDTEPGGSWICYVVDPQGTSDFTQGTTTVSAVRRIGSRKKTVQAIATATRDYFTDMVRLGTGVTIKDGTSGTPVTFQDIYSAGSSSSTAWGVVTTIGGVWYVAGKMNFGTGSQTAITYFKDTTQVIIYNNYPVAIGFYNITVVGASSYLTTFQLGAYSGGLASGGVTIKGAYKSSSDSNPSVRAHAVWTLDADDTYARTYLYGSTFSELYRGYFNSSSEIRYCTFAAFGDIEANGCLIDNCTFQNVETAAPISGTYALIVDSTSEVNSKITNSKFINCNRAIKITAAGSYTFSGLTFSGNSYDIENSSAGTVTVSNTNGSNATTYINTGGGTTVILNPITLTVNSVASGDRVGVFRATGDNNIVDRSMFTSHTSANTSGSGTYTITVAIPVDTPASGTLYAVQRDSAGDITAEQIYTYTSWTGSVFTLSGTLSQTYDSNDTAYVPYIDVQASGTSVTASINYVSDRYVTIRVRKKGIIPFQIKSQIISTGMTATAIRTTDSIVV